MDKKKVTVDYISGTPDGDIKLAINGEVYEYDFGCKETYENYMQWYGRNKGRFLAKIKGFLKKDSTPPTLSLQ